jgi:hypothetical protein
MHNYDEARTKVIEELNRGYDSLEDEIIIEEERTIKKSYGWIFFYNSKRYLETEEISYMLIGNSPIIFERDSGNFVRLPSAYPAEQSIAHYEKLRNSA